MKKFIKYGNNTWQKDKYLRYFLQTSSQKNRAFVLSYAVLISGILLAIGLGIFTITMKELTISSSGRDSQSAFYAADTGGECALYWDIRHSGFSDSVFATSSDSSILPSGSGVNCAGQDMTIKASGWDSANGWDVDTNPSDGATTKFDMKFDNGSCATVYVFKGSHAGGAGNTRIDSHGFNTCDEGSPKRVERGLRITY